MRIFSHREAGTTPAAPTPLQLRAAYAVCRSISRAAARNFYYSFLALPREKRDAICAVYAFMRHADDISDEPALSVEEKRARLADWVRKLNQVIEGAATDDPVLLAISDTRQRFNIPTELLEALVHGTSMDLQQSGAGENSQMPELSIALGMDHSAGTSPGITAPAFGAEVQYQTFADLYEYCYHVASVVGLVCIRIYGYKDVSAEPLAEHCGVAFQLTNIIRDVKEDAAMGRVYLPQEDLQRFGLDASALLNGGCSAPDIAVRFRAVLELEARRAREFYDAAEQLLPLIEEDSRPALWVLVTIYRRLLEKIAAAGYDVFREKVRLSFSEKARILAKGIWMRIT